MSIVTSETNTDQWFNDLSTSKHESDSFAISRVITYNRESNKKHYEPQLVSIGPYHHRNVKLQPMVAHKRRYLRDFLVRNNNNNLGSYIHEMRRLEAHARRFYNEKIHLTSDEFVEMLLVDGCFILELSFKLQSWSDKLLSLGWDRKALLLDILMLENQIPYFVLEKLLNVDGLDKDLEEFLAPIFFILVGEEVSTVQGQPPQGSTYHLLHLYHQLFMPSRGNNLISFSHRSHSKITKNGSENRSILLIPSATKLNDYGIPIRKKTLASDVLDISFSLSFKFNAIFIKIPTFLVNSNLKTTYMNLLAFEESLDSSERRLTSLVLLMASLIQTPEDIKFLENKGIFVNQLSSNEDALCFFRDLKRLVCFDQLNDHYFAGLFSGVARFCEEPWPKERERLISDYFTDPWAIVSLYGSIFAFTFSIIQTVLTVLTYRHPS